MPLFSKESRRKLTACLLIYSTTVSPVFSAPPILEKVFQVGSRQGHQPVAPQDASIEELARNIDWLEHEIDRWGTVVAKSPDVWGEARLTKYRAEIEDAFEQNVKRGFQENQINGAQFISDQAFLAAAFALQAKPAGGAATVPVPTAVAGAGNSAGATTTAQATQTPLAPLQPFGSGPRTIGGDISNIKLEQTTMLDQKKRFLEHLNELRRMNEGDDVSDSPGYALNLIRIPISVIPGKHSQEGYGAEITITATAELGPELLPTAFRDFVINDLVDQLSVPLVQFLNTDPEKARDIIERIEAIENRPKVMARLHERFAKGFVVVREPAVVEILSDLNLQGSLGFELFDPSQGLFPPMRVDAAEVQAALLRDIGKLQILLGDFAALAERRPQLEAAAAQATLQAEQVGTQAASILSAQLNSVATDTFTPPAPTNAAEQAAAGAGQSARLRVLNSVVDQKARTMAQARLQTESPDALPSLTDAMKTNIVSQLSYESELQQSVVQASLAELGGLRADLTTIQPEALAITTVNIASSSRRATLPFPPSQLLDNYGMHDLGHVALEAYRAFEHEIINRQIVHLTDVQAYLREEMNAAYDMMCLPAVQSFWEFEASGQRTLVDALKHRRTSDVEQLRSGFREALAPHLQHSATLTLAWCVFVESLLLNERILDDMHKNAACPNWLPLFGPNPPAESRDAFNAYVAQRWPVRVFAVDPVTTDQNISDVSSISRQMQLAVALAFAGGEVSASTALQTLRQLQRDTATIDLNHTVVGFGHGENIFGWRFYPRFQTPKVKGNAPVFFRDLIAGGPTDKQILRDRRLEPGMRECTAIVLMPSFVPGISFDTRANWFKLDKPSHTALSMHENVQYSRSIVAMRENAQACVRCPDRYRPGELERMLKRVEQLEAELPLQTQRVPLPIENSHGGFEIFSSGTRELAPELLGWYGAPGYDPAAGGTFFLAGDNFSIHETQLIVGNKSHQFDLLSRQVMRVDLPPGLHVVQDERLKKFHDGRLKLPESIEPYLGFVDAHVATPYGVSGHLLIPVIKGAMPKACDCGAKLTTQSLKLELSISKNSAGKESPDGLNPFALPLVSVSIPATTGLLGRTTNFLLQPMAPEGPLAPVKVEGVTAVSDGYQLDGISAINILKSDGALTKSIFDYVFWIRQRQPTYPAEVKLKCSVKAEIGGLSVNLGTVDMTVSVKPPVN